MYKLKSNKNYKIILCPLKFYSQLLNLQRKIKQINVDVTSFFFVIIDLILGFVAPRFIDVTF